MAVSFTTSPLKGRMSEGMHLFLQMAVASSDGVL